MKFCNTSTSKTWISGEKVYLCTWGFLGMAPRLGLGAAEGRTPVLLELAEGALLAPWLGVCQKKLYQNSVTIM